MINPTVMKTVALAALLSMGSACQAADLVVGKHLTTQELAQYASAPVVQIESQSFKVLSSGTRTKSAGATSAAVTQVANGYNVTAAGASTYTMTSTVGSCTATISGPGGTITNSC